MTWPICIIYEVHVYYSIELCFSKVECNNNNEQIICNNVQFDIRLILFLLKVDIISLACYIAWSKFFSCQCFYLYRWKIWSGSCCQKRSELRSYKNDYKRSSLIPKIAQVSMRLILNVWYLKQFSDACLEEKKRYFLNFTWKSQMCKFVTWIVKINVIGKKHFHKISVMSS